MKKLQKDKIISTILKYHPSVTAIYLFGSYTSGENREPGDIDIAVLLSPESSGESKNTDLQFELETVFNKRIDLVYLRKTNTVLQKEIIMADTRIFCSDQYAADEFEMLVISKYQKLNEEREEIIKDALKTGVFISI